jgi:DAACS family dicarboxylate/amino acid:cation (Na+ or H+) symporter
MLAGLALGVTLGVIAHMAFGDAPALQQFVRLVTEPAGKIFLRLLFVLVLPLIVSALALGVSGLGDVRALGRIGLKTLAYTVVVSSIAVLIGVALVNAFQPGRGLSPELRTRLLAQATAAPAPRRPRARPASTSSSAWCRTTSSVRWATATCSR